jgi:glutaredoxin
MNETKILLYTKSGCPWCQGVLDLFAEKDVQFEEREVYGNKEWFAEMVGKSGQEKAPVLDFGGEVLADTDREAVALFMKSRDYKNF